MSFIVSSLKGKVQNKSMTLIHACIKAMLTLTDSPQALSIFNSLLQEIVDAYMGSFFFGGSTLSESDKEHKVSTIGLKLSRIYFLYKFWTGIIRCGQDFQQWKEIVQNLIYDRVSKVCMMHFIIILSVIR